MDLKLHKKVFTQSEYHDNETTIPISGDQIIILLPDNRSLAIATKNRIYFLNTLRSDFFIMFQVVFRSFLF